ncbi:MAG: helix-turn-helix transcriptional regulator [Clostridia bacterium]|nr:helix-turn-helix transcriptional regulator [Clostridia bacterium]
MRNRVEELRKERGISQYEFARAIRVSRQTVSSIENGKYNPSLELAFMIAEYFGMKIEEIFLRERSTKHE